MIINIICAKEIKESSWLNNPDCAWFLTGYGYAAHANQSIPGLSKMEPEELYYVVANILYGAEGDVPYVVQQHSEFIALKKELAELKAKHGEK